MHQTTLITNEQASHRWWQASAKGAVLGPLAVRIATALMGRGKRDWTPHTDAGDYVVVTDAEAVVVTRNKAQKKTYRFHSGYFGGITELSFATLQAKDPERIIHLAVKRMLPKTVQGRHMLKRLKVFKGSAHPHGPQRPQPLPA